MHLIGPREKDEWFRDHLPHRLSILVSPIVRTGNRKQWPDFHQAALHGSFVVFRSLLEFAGLKSDPKKRPVKLCPHVSRYDSDIQIRDFGHALVSLNDSLVAKHADLLAITHDGVSKACAHLTSGSGHTFDVNRHYVPACAALLDLLARYLYQPEGRAMTLMPSLSRAGVSVLDEIKKHKPA